MLGRLALPGGLLRSSSMAPLTKHLNMAFFASLSTSKPSDASPTSNSATAATRLQPITTPFNRRCSNITNHQSDLEKYIKRLNEITEKSREPSLDKAKYTSVIGSLYHDAGDFAKAIEYFTKSFNMYQAFGSDNPKTLIDLLKNIASTQNSLQNYFEAIKSYEQAIDLCHKKGSGTAATISDMHRSAALIAEKINDFENALKHHLLITHMTNPHDGPNMALNFKNMGNCYLNMNDFENAIEYLKISLEMHQATDLYSRTNSWAGAVVQVLVLLSRAFMGSHDYKKSLEHSLQAESIRKEKLSLDWNMTVDAVIYATIGESYMRLGNFKDAQMNLFLALKHMRKISDNNDLLARVYFLIGETCQNDSQGHCSLNHALDFYFMSLDVQDCKDTTLFVETNLALGRLHRTNKEFDMALKYFRTISAHLEEALVMNDLTTQNAFLLELTAETAFCNIQLGELEAARFDSRDALSLMKGMSPNEYENMKVFHLILALGDAWLLAGEYHEALEFYRLLSDQFSHFLQGKEIYVQVLRSTAEAFRKTSDIRNYNKYTNLAILNAELLDNPNPA